MSEPVRLSLAGVADNVDAALEQLELQYPVSHQRELVYALLSRTQRELKRMEPRAK